MDHVSIPDYLGLTESGAKISLHRDAVTQGFALLGKRGRGKTNSIGCMLETFAMRRQPFVVLDPPDANWGIRFAADSEGRPCGPSGFDVLLIGGDHGDVPLDPSSGKEIARIIVDGNISAVISMRALGYTAQQRFCADFGEELFLLNRTPRHVIFEEAQNLLPQVLKFEEQKRVLYAMTKIVAEGRGLGLGFTIASQRPAKISKDVLEEADNFMALGMIGPRDLEQVTDWFKHHVSRDKEKLETIIDDVARLKPGDCWFLSPEWLKEIVKFHVRLRVTYHAGRTPKPGESTVNLAKFTVTEAVEKLKTLFSEKRVAVHQEAASLKEANLEIRRLKAQLRTAPSHHAPAATPAPVIDKRAIERAIREAIVPWRKKSESQHALLMRFANLASKMAEMAAAVPYAAVTDTPVPWTPSEVEKSGKSDWGGHPVAAEALKTEYPSSAKASGNGDGLPPGEKAILLACAQCGPGGAARAQLSILTGYKRSSRDVYISRLAAKGFIEARMSMVIATTQGIEALGSQFEPLPTGEALINYWLGRLPPGEKKIFAILVRRDEPVDREFISTETGYLRSSRDVYLSRLAVRKLVQVTGPGQVKAADMLFLD